MLVINVNLTGLQEVQSELEKVRAERIPHMLDVISFKLCMATKRHAIGNLGGKVLKRRSASLVKFVNAQKVERAGSLTLFGLPEGEPTAVYGEKQERGGDILPRAKRCLRIPLDAAKTKAGVDLWSNTPLLSADAGFFVWKSKSGNIFIAKQGDRSGKLELWYLLRPKATLPARPWFAPAVQAAVAELPRIADQEVARELERK